MARLPAEPARQPGADADASGAAPTLGSAGLVVRLRQRVDDLAPDPDPHGHRTGDGLRAIRRPGLRKPRLPQLPTAARLVSALAALLVGLGDGVHGHGPHDAGLLAWHLQVSARAEL